MENWLDLQPLYAWIQAHPAWAGICVMLLSLGESLLIFGLIVPGTVVMFGIGALVGNGVMPLWSTIGWAILGAIFGDYLSYWLGWYYRDQIQQWWPFSRYPEILRRGQAFFQKHGGKS
ncbi:MAG: phosphoesterase PA-phosphatase, partial [Gammaproteobacteria bacterium]|nr:phosphoesterase PA-phosphatase [Gammaproteobacteria bacterium]